MSKWAKRFLWIFLRFPKDCFPYVDILCQLMVHSLSRFNNYASPYQLVATRIKRPSKIGKFTDFVHKWCVESSKTAWVRQSTKSTQYTFSWAEAVYAILPNVFWYIQIYFILFLGRKISSHHLIIWRYISSKIKMKTVTLTHIYILWDSILECAVFVYEMCYSYAHSADDGW